MNASHLQPCIAEVLRTCIKPISIVLRIVRIVMVSQETEESSPKQRPQSVPRFSVTDGQLVLQALLTPTLLADTKFKVGDFIEVTEFTVRKAKKLNGEGKVIFLGIQDCSLLGQHLVEDWTDEGGFIRETTRVAEQETSPRGRRFTSPPSQTGVGLTSISSTATMSSTSERLNTTKPGQKHARQASKDSESDFESTEVNLFQVQRRRQALRNLQANTSTSQVSEFQETAQPLSGDPHEATSAVPTITPPVNPTLTRTGPTSTRPSRSSPESANPPPPTHHLPKLPTHLPPPITIPPYQPLSSLLHHPLSTPATIFVLTTYVSPNLISKPNSPFPPKRNIKLVDPSLFTHPLGTHYPQGVMLAVFKDARTFLPKVGDVLLIRGVVVQKITLRDGAGAGREGVILNVYANVTEKLAGMVGAEGGVPMAGGEEKWVERDEGRLEEMGWDVKGLKGWWEEKGRSSQA
jgi:hypothetical protein